MSAPFAGLIRLATAVRDGLMSAADKAKLDGLAAGAAVVSVFGRAGAVVAAVGDYVTSEIDNDSSVSGTTLKDALNALLGRAHATLGSLGADDHTQYALVTGTRAFTGPITANAFLESPATFAYAANVTLDVGAKADHVMSNTLTGPMAVAFSNVAAGRKGFIAVKQDGTGSRAVSFTMPGGYTQLRNYDVVDLSAQQSANSVTLYTYWAFALGGVNYFHITKAFQV